MIVSLPFCAPDSPPDTGASMKGETAPGRDLRELARDVRRRRRVVDERRAFRHALECAVLAEDDAAQVVVVAHAGEHRSAPSGRLARRARGASAVLRVPTVRLRDVRLYTVTSSPARARWPAIG